MTARACIGMMPIALSLWASSGVAQLPLWSAELTTTTIDQSGGTTYAVWEAITAGPVIHSIAEANNGVVVEYSVPAGTTGHVYRRMVPDGWRRPSAWTTTTEPGEAPGSFRLFDSASFEVGREYCYMIVAEADNGTDGDSESPIACHVFGGGDDLPAPPGDLSIHSREPNRLLLSFEDRSDNEDGFVIERSVPGTAEWVEAKVLGPADGPGFSIITADPDVEMEISYCYRMFSFNGSGVRYASSGTCGSTTAMNHPSLDRSKLGNEPYVISVRHPLHNALGVTVDVAPQSGARYDISLYERGRWNDPVRTTRVTEHRAPPASKIGVIFEDLDPGLTYCAKVNREGSSETNMLCESPFSPRMSASDVGPTEDALPSIDEVEVRGPDHVRVWLDAPAPGTMLDVRRSGLNTRRSSLTVFNGSTDGWVTRLAADTEYCFRVLLTNDFGSRFGPETCARTAQDPGGGGGSGGTGGSGGSGGGVEPPPDVTQVCGIGGCGAGYHAKEYVYDDDCDGDPRNNATICEEDTGLFFYQCSVGNCPSGYVEESTQHSLDCDLGGPLTDNQTKCVREPEAARFDLTISVPVSQPLAPLRSR